MDFKSRFSISRYFSDLRVPASGGKSRDIKINSLFGLIIEPQAWSNFLHGVSFQIVLLLSLLRA
jgi:hypothetical protein